MKIYLCRHGQTTGDIEDRYGGDYDDHLTELGRKQATELANKLVDKKIERIFSSSMVRAQETAKNLSEKLGVPIETVGGFRERNQNGILTGMIKSEAKEKYPDLVDQLKDYQNAIDGAEQYQVFSDRVTHSFKEVLNRNETSIVIVTHGGPIRALFRGILKDGEVKIGDCAYAEIEGTSGVLKVTNLDGITREV